MRLTKVEVLRETIKIVVAALAEKSVPVTQAGSRAFVEWHPVTGKVKRINIPYVPDNASDRLVKAVQGFVDHECAHVLFTDFNCVKAAIKSGAGMVGNILEDTYIEREMRKLYKGSRHNLLELWGFVAEELLQKPLDEAIEKGSRPLIVANGLPICIHAWAGNEAAVEFMDTRWEAFRDIKEIIGDDIIDQIPNIACSKDGLLLAVAIKNRLMEWKEKEEREEKERRREERKEREKEEGKPEPDPDAEGSPGEPDMDDVLDPEMEEGEPDPSAPDDPDAEESSDTGDDECEPGDGGDDEDEDFDEEDDEFRKASPRTEDDEEEESEGDAGDSDEEGDEDEEEEEGSVPTEDGDDEEEEEIMPSPSADEDEESEEGKDGDDSDSDEEAKDGKDSEEEHGTTSPEGAPTPEEEKEEEEIEAEDISDFESDAEEILEAMEDMDDLEGLTNELIGEEMQKALATTDYWPLTKDADIVERYTPKNTNPEYVRKRQKVIDQHIGQVTKRLQRMIQAKSHDRKIPGFRSGKLDGASLHRVPTGDDRVFRRVHKMTTKDVDVQLVVDLSGSMQGSKVELATEIAYAVGVALDRLGINNQIVGFTTADMSLVSNHADIVAEQGDRKPSRYEPVYMPILKDWAQHFTADRQSAVIMSAKDVRLRNNIDGESVEYAGRMLWGQPGARKLMIVLSDGCPSARGNYQEQAVHLRRVVKRLEALNTEVFGIGIMDESVKRFYKNAIVIHKLEDLLSKVMRVLEDMLMRGAL